MSDSIKCTCSHCGAKYRLPVEAQGRTARCKKCGDKFEVPREASLEDTVLTWLTESDADDELEAVDQPRVITMPTSDTEGSQRYRGPIRKKVASEEAK